MSKYLFLPVFVHVSILNLKVQLYLRENFENSTMEKEWEQNEEERREDKSKAEIAPDESNRQRETCFYIIKDKVNAGHTVRHPSSSA